MKKLNHFLSSYIATIILLAFYAFGLAAATFIEKYHGTDVAKSLIYYSPLFFSLQFLMVVNFIMIIIKYRYFQRRRWALIVVHFAFIVILLGALITHLFGKDGMVHIREGETTNQITLKTPEGIKYETLPFTLKLVDFRLIRYPGSESPSSYESDLLVEYADGKIQKTKVYMNNVLNVKGYRFFQASFDKDEMGTLLSVNKDGLGKTITYSGYFLLLIGFILVFTTKNSRFRQLNLQLKEVKKTYRSTITWLLFLVFPCTLSAQHMPPINMMEAVQKNAIDPQHAARFGELPMQWNGRIVPVNTFSSEILRKVHKELTIGKLNSDQFLLSFLSMPQMWMQVPFIAVSNKEISHYYQLPLDYCAYFQLIDEEGNYVLMTKLQEAYYKLPAERSSFDKDLIKLDERVNIVSQLLNCQLLCIFPHPTDSIHTWYAPGKDLSTFPKEDSLFITRSFAWYLSEVNSALKSGNWNKPNQLLQVIGEYQKRNDTASQINHRKLNAEIRYNRLDIFGHCQIGYFILGGLLVVFAFIGLFKPKKWLDTVIKILTGGIFLIFMYHLYGMGLRAYISGYAPWSNSYETMVYAGWATILAGFVFGRKSSTVPLALATLFGGIILFVSELNWMDPQINPLVPVLKSPWLMFHVAILVAAYGFFGVSFLLGIANLTMMVFYDNNSLISYRVKELSIINQMALMIGLALMCIGTFLGAIWANESWGRYWGWDPKETWALITIVMYTIVTHIHLIKKGNSDWLFNVLSIIAFSSVLMTFFGVNYFFSGMHSYGQNDAMKGIIFYLSIPFVLISFLAVFSYKRSRRSEQIITFFD
ncbi:cytochrome c biogenesis protein CcsA [Anaerorudis cellulosivorans]|uniref:cytochrome c biogenesis protein CcsA n=1 Tax=Anaerorudis cellulosivorans TaxID=3397862 RepID=UPI0022207415|nr:cytochrome c biogenesis protein CcsA [Seramator thermalis]MCW1736163.1 cytochrome c biogenesis protein CcsA [Seramator thermalis]